MAERPSTAESSPEITLEDAARRLERAVALLEGRVGELSSRAEGAAGGLFDIDRSQLAAELDQARARERELQEAGAEASDALGRAISEIRQALGGAGAG